MLSSLKGQWKRGKSNLIKRIKQLVLVRYKLLLDLSQYLTELLTRYRGINS